MKVDFLITGLIALLLGLIGLATESNKSAKENKERGWNYTRTKFLLATWTLILAGTILTVIGLFGGE